MARKKKPKARSSTDKDEKSPKTETAGEDGRQKSVPAKRSAPKKKAADTEGSKKGAGDQEPSKKKASRKKASKKKTPKKKRARKKAEKADRKTGDDTSAVSASEELSARKSAREAADAEGQAPSPPEPEAPPPPPEHEELPVEILDDDLDQAETVEELVADLGVELQDGAAVDVGRGTRESTVEVDDLGAGEDLDADLDEDQSAPDVIGRLIAETLAVANATESEAAAEREDAVVDVAEPMDAPTELATGPGPHEPQPKEVPQGAATASGAGGSEPGDADAEPLASLRVDRGAVTTPEVRDRLLAEVVAHAEYQDARYRVPYSDARRINRWKGLIASLIFLIALVAVLAPPAWVRPAEPPQLAPAARARAIRLALLLQAQQVEAYRVTVQRLPATLDELPERLPGVRYTRSGNRAFQLVAYEPDGNPIVYDSSDPAPQFQALEGSWTPKDRNR